MNVNRALRFLLLSFTAFAAVVSTPLHAAQATTYYVDSLGGSDAQAGTTTTAPWKTIAKVSSHSLKAGDSVLFLKGDTWREQLTVSGTGTSSAPITYGAYGSGTAPVISAANLVSPTLWANYSGNIYVANVGVLANLPNQLYVDGVYQELARYPTSAYLKASASSGSLTSVVDATLATTSNPFLSRLLTSSDIAGATLVARTSDWSSGSAVVTGYDASSDTTTVGSNLSYIMPAGYGYFFRNKLWMLQAPGEWFYDANAGKLYVWTKTGDSPANHSVEFSERNYGIAIGHSYVTVNGLQFNYALQDNINISSGTTGLLIINNALNGAQHGIESYSTASVFQNNAIEGALNEGIEMHGSNNTVSSNVVDNTANLPVVPDNFEPTGISVSVGSNVITGNTVTNSAYNGIRADQGYNEISNNIVNNSCLKLDDCAGIYSSYASDPANSYVGTIISGNTVSNSIGNIDGTSVTQEAGAQGIYLDNNHHDVVVQNNKVTNTDIGIFLHDGYNDTVTGNSVFAARLTGVAIGEDSSAPNNYTHGDVILGNVFETLSSSLGSAWYADRTTADTNFGTYNFNTFCHPNIVASVSQQYLGSGLLNYNLSAWQQGSGQDAQSIDQPTSCPNAMPLSIAPTISLSAAPTSIANNATTTLTWSTLLATSCTGSGGWSGGISVSGSYTTPALTTNTVYTLTCVGIGGTTSQSITVTVGGAGPSLTLVANPSSVASGGTSKLSWSSSNATACTAAGGLSPSCEASAALWTSATFSNHQVRGFNEPYVTSATMSEMASTGANLVRVFAFLTINPATDTYTIDLTDVNNAVRYAALYGYRVVIVFAPNTTLPSPEFWTDKQLQSSIVSIWQSTAAAYKGNPLIAGYDLINEPIAPSGQAQWVTLATNMITAIRAVDPDHVVIFEPSPGANIDSFGLMTGPLPFTNIVYSLHDYEPHQITHQGILYPTRETYPSPASSDIGVVNKDTLSGYLAKVEAFQAKYNVPIYVGEFSCVRWAPGTTAYNYVADQISLFEAQGWSWSYHAWQSYPGWDAEVPESYFQAMPYVNGMPQGWLNNTNPWIPYRSETSDTMTLIKQYFASNMKVSPLAAACMAPTPWAGDQSTSGSYTTTTLTAPTLYSLTCTGTGGSVTQTATVYTYVNGSCGSANGMSVSTAPTTNLCAAGSATGVSGSGPWTWDCMGTSGGSTTACVALVQATPPPLVTISVDRPTVSVGAAATLTWSVTGATSCTASGGWSGVKASAGTITTSALNATTTYSLACTGAGGLTTQSVVVTVEARPTTYYVDATGGNDLNDGGSAATPWKTIAQVNATSFLPGDTILFKKGETWREELDIQNSGTSTSPITIASYGSSPTKPVISGADVVTPTSWSKYNNNIYVANIGALITPNPLYIDGGGNLFTSSVATITYNPPGQVYVDGTYQELARYPATGWLTTTASAASSDKTSIIDNGLSALLGSNNIIGSTIVAKDASWESIAGAVTAFNGTAGIVTTGQNVHYPMPSGWGFYFRNMLWMLQAAGEWYYDGSGNLYLWTAAGDNPSAHTVEVANRNYGINIGAHNYINISGITITYPQVSGIYAATGAAGDTINGVSIYGSVSGVLLYCTSCTVENSLIEGATHHGLYVSGSANIVSNNTIDNAANVAVAPDTTEPSSVHLKGSSNTVSGNTVTNSGYSGITIDVGSNSTVTGNTVNQSCLKLQDCAGIYTVESSATNTDTGVIITKNSVSNSIGNYGGTPYGYTQAQGIYIDNWRHDVTVTNNNISNTDHGIFIHIGYNNIVINNQVHGSRMSALDITQDAMATSGFVHDNLVIGNVFETTATLIGAAGYYNALDSSINFGTFNNNTYCHPNSPAVASWNTTGSYKNYNLSAWQGATGQDMQSTDMMQLCPNASAPAILPAITLTVAASPIAYNSVATLTWSTALATSCTASGDWSGTEATSGSFTTPALTANGNYTLSCTGVGGTATQSVAVSVTPPAPTLIFTAAPSSVPSGSTVTLSWAATNATSCAASGGWSGPEATSGTLTTTALTTSTSYTLICTGVGGVVTKVVSVPVFVNGVCGSANGVTTASIPTANLCSAGTSSTVTGSGPWAWTCAGINTGSTASCSAPALPTLTLSASPQKVNNGSRSVLSWSSTNVTACTASGGWGGSEGTSGTFTTPALTAATNYTLSCVGIGGTAIQTVSVSVFTDGICGSSNGTVMSTAPATNLCTAGMASAVSGKGPWTWSCIGLTGGATASCATTLPQAPTVSLIATPASIAVGSSASLAWSSTNASSCTASGNWTGMEGVSGHYTTAALSANATYTLTCTGLGGTTASTSSVSVYTNGVCGSSNRTPVGRAPAANLCSAGTPSTVAGTGPWTWTCAGINSGSSASCTAPVLPAPTLAFTSSPTTVANGSSAILTWSSANTSSCTASGGWTGAKAISGLLTTSALTATTSYTLVCTGAGGTITKTLNVPVYTNGTCGSSNGLALISLPTTNLCSAGSASSVSGTGPWTWSCTGINGGTTASCSATLLPAPTVTFTATPVTLANGSSSVLSWASTNATGCTASKGWTGTKTAAGTFKTPALNTSTDYTLTCTGAGGSTTKSLSITVYTNGVCGSSNNASMTSAPTTNLCNAGSASVVTGTGPWTWSCAGINNGATASCTASVQAAPTITLTATPATIASGSTSVLAWTTANATNCTASNGWTGVKALSGSVTTSAPSTSTDYTLVCTGLGGTVTKTTSVSVFTNGVCGSSAGLAAGSAPTTNLCSAGKASTVSGSGPWNWSCAGINNGITASCTAPVLPAPTVTLSATPATISSGSTSVLAWTSINATSCTAFDGWTGIKATSGHMTTSALTATTSFTLVCEGAGGSTSKTVNVSVFTNGMCGSSNGLALMSAPSSNLCSAGVASAVSGNGPWSWSCAGINSGSSASCGATLQPAPTLTLTATPATIANGHSSVLAWNSANATSCTASGNWTGTQTISGSLTTSVLNSNATYTLNCTGLGGSVTKTASVSVFTNGVCGSSDGLALISAPETNLCKAGSASTVVGNGPWNWSCAGINGGSTASCNATVQPAPTLILTASPATVANGSVSVIAWSATNATSCTASNGWAGTKATSGSFTTSALSANTDYSLVCTGPGGSVTKNATVIVFTDGVCGASNAVPVVSAPTVNLCSAGTASTVAGNGPWTWNCAGINNGSSASCAAPVLPAPTLSLTATPMTIANGSTTVVTWTSTNTTSCTASGDWTGTKASSGSQTSPALSANATFSLTCVGAGGSTTQTANVVVFTNGACGSSNGALLTTAPTSNLCSAGTASAVYGTGPWTWNCAGLNSGTTASCAASLPSAPTVNFAATQASVASGSIVTLNWNSTNATSCIASDGWNGTQASSGTYTTPPLTSSTVYSLSCTNAGGTTTQVVNVSVFTNGSCGSANGTIMTAVPTANLCNTGNASTVSGAGPWTWSCAGINGGTTAFCAANPPAAPTLTFSASPLAVNSGTSSTLSWMASNATSCTASGAWNGTQATSGLYVTDALTSAASYSLTCFGPGGSVTQALNVVISTPGVCGPANGTAATLAPSSNLCITGTPTSVSGTGPWTWTCTGSNGGPSSSCATTNPGLGGGNTYVPVSGSPITGSPVSGSPPSVGISAFGTGSGGSGGGSGGGSSGSASGSSAASILSPNQSPYASDSVVRPVATPSESKPDSKLAPTLSLSADPGSVSYNGTTTLAWIATNVSGCTASDGWSGDTNVVGVTTMPKLHKTTKYSIVCVGPNGTIKRSLTVHVDLPVRPTLKLVVSDHNVNADDSVTLKWESTDANSCKATDNWTDVTSVTGEVTIPAVTKNTIYTLTCVGDGGTVKQSVSVKVHRTK